MSHELSVYRLEIKIPPHETLLILDIGDVCRDYLALAYLYFFTLFFPLWFPQKFTFKSNFIFYTRNYTRK